MLDENIKAEPSKEAPGAETASEFERLSGKTAELLREAALAYERIGKDQQEIEQLKMETRALLAGLRAA